LPIIGQDSKKASVSIFELWFSFCFWTLEKRFDLLFRVSLYCSIFRCRTEQAICFKIVEILARATNCPKFERMCNSIIFSGGVPESVDHFWFYGGKINGYREHVFHKHVTKQLRGMTDPGYAAVKAKKWKSAELAMFVNPVEVADADSDSHEVGGDNDDAMEETDDDVKDDTLDTSLFSDVYAFQMNTPFSFASLFQQVGFDFETVKMEKKWALWWHLQPPVNRQITSTRLVSDARSNPGFLDFLVGRSSHTDKIDLDSSIKFRTQPADSSLYSIPSYGSVEADQESVGMTHMLSLATASTNVKFDATGISQEGLVKLQGAVHPVGCRLDDMIEIWNLLTVSVCVSCFFFAKGSISISHFIFIRERIF